MALPLSKLPMDFRTPPKDPYAAETEELNWMRVVSAVSLVTGGALLLAGKPRLGLVAVAAGTTVALIDQQETVKKWWASLPEYIADVQSVLTQVQETVDEVAVQREKLGRVLEKAKQNR